MTVDLIDVEAAEVEEFLVYWLNPLGPTAFKRRAGDPLPQRVVRRATGLEDECESLDLPVVSVHTFCATDGSATADDAAADECKRTHKRMMYLARELPEIVLPTGQVACLEFLDCTEKPIWVDYQDDSILRKVGRYQIGLTLVTT